MMTALMFLLLGFAVVASLEIGPVLRRELWPAGMWRAGLSR